MKYFKTGSWTISRYFLYLKVKYCSFVHLRSSPGLDEVEPHPQHDDRQLFVAARIARLERVGAVDQRRSEHERQLVSVAVPHRPGSRRRLGRAVAERVQVRADRGRRRSSPGCVGVGTDDRRVTWRPPFVVPVHQECFLEVHLSCLGLGEGQADYRVPANLCPRRLPIVVQSDLGWGLLSIKRVPWKFVAWAKTRWTRWSTFDLCPWRLPFVDPVRWWDHLSPEDPGSVSGLRRRGHGRGVRPGRRTVRRRGTGLPCLWRRKLCASPTDESSPCCQPRSRRLGEVSVIHPEEKIKVRLGMAPSPFASASVIRIWSELWSPHRAESVPISEIRRKGWLLCHPFFFFSHGHSCTLDPNFGLYVCVISSNVGVIHPEEKVNTLGKSPVRVVVR